MAWSCICDVVTASVNSEKTRLKKLMKIFIETPYLNIYRLIQV